MNRLPAVLTLLLGAAALAALFLWLRPPADFAPASAPPSPAVAEPEAEPRSFGDDALARAEWVVRDGRRQSGPAKLSVPAGRSVVLRVTSDRADELHLHGYELHAELQAGEPGTLVFTAAHSGRFELELHRQHLPLAVLEVVPPRGDAD